MHKGHFVYVLRLSTLRKCRWCDCFAIALFFGLFFFRTFFNGRLSLPPLFSGFVGAYAVRLSYHRELKINQTHIYSEAQKVVFSTYFCLLSPLRYAFR